MVGPMALTYVLPLVSDRETEIQNMSRFRRGDVSLIADFIEERFLKVEKSARVFLSVDGKRIPMKPFVRDLVDSVIRGMVGTFKGAEEAKEISIFLQK